MTRFSLPAITGIAQTIVLTVAMSGGAIAQTDHSSMSHTGMTHDSGGTQPAESATKVGQAAFAAIAEIVDILRADPDTDWSKVDVEALRLHLIDMDNVTLRAGVAARLVGGGVEFEVTSPMANVTDSIRRMTIAHAATMNGFDGMEMQAAEISHGARLTVTGPNADMILGLGFIGVMTLGMHHQAHHLALASGVDPHQH